MSMSSSPGLGESYFKHSRTELPHSPISHNTTNYSYSSYNEQPYINGTEVLLEEITHNRSGSSLDQNNKIRRETTPISPNTSSKLNSPSPSPSPQPRRWRLIPATCSCPVHGSTDYGVGNTSFTTEEDYHHTRFTSSRGKVLDEELDRLKGSVHQLESEMLQSKGIHSQPKRTNNKANGTHSSYRTSSYRERTEIESTRKELESELKGWQGKLLEQMEALKKKLETETTQRSIKEHDLASKIHQCERLQHQLDDAHKRLNLQEERISELTAAKNKAKERLQEVLDEREYSRSRDSETSKKFSDEMRRVLENEMEVRVRVETELQNLQKLVEREMGEAVDARKELNAKKRELDTTKRELETVRETNTRLEREVHKIRTSTHTDKSRYSEELERKELDYQELRNQLDLVTTQLEREREQHNEQMREKIQELNRLQQELQRLQKRIAELEALLDKASNKHKQTDTETIQLRSKNLELQRKNDQLEKEVIQLKDRLRALERERDRMVETIHDLQSQIDALQSKSDASFNSSDQERARNAQLIRDLEAQIEDLRNKYDDAREIASKMASEVDETNSALEEVRTALEKEMELKAEGDKLFKEEVRQWREKEGEWEQERSQLKEMGGGGYDSAKLDQMQADIERIEVERLKELDERDAIIDELRERIAELEAEGEGGRSDDKAEFEERIKLQVEGFQEQVKDLCIQLEESAAKLDKEVKARQDAENAKKRVEKALLELNAKLQASPKPARDADAQIASLKHKLAQAEDELSKSQSLDEFEFDPELISSDNDSIEDSDEQVRVKLSDIQRALRKLNEFSASSNSISRITHEISREHHEEHHEDHYEEDHQPNGHHNEEEEQEHEQEEEQEEELEEEQEEQQEEEEQEEQEHEEEQEIVHDEEEEEKEEEVVEAPMTPNGTKRVHFGDISPPTSPHQPATPITPPSSRSTSTPTTPTPALPSNDAERERLQQEWNRKVASSANKYTHSRIPIQSSLRLYPTTPTKAPESPPKPARANDTEAIKQRIEGLRRSADFTTPKTPEKPAPSPAPAPAGPAPGFYYVPVKSDEIDEELSKVVSETDASQLADIPKNFTRLEKGVYQFGLKKLHMQINNGSLVVRVGGGFMLFVDYLARHAKVENVKFQRDEARKRFETPKKEDPPRELLKHNDTIQMGTLVRRGPKLMLVTKN